METAGSEDVLLPTEHMQHVGQALPDLTNELISAHTTQSSEISLKEKTLLSLQRELEIVQGQLLATNRDVCKSVRTICLREDLLADLTQEYEDLEREVTKLVEEREGMCMSLQKVKQEQELEEKTRVKYKTKMEDYQVKINEMEESSATQLQLQALREKISLLKGKST